MPPLVLRLAGRLPMLSPPSSLRVREERRQPCFSSHTHIERGLAAPCIELLHFPALFYHSDCPQDPQ